MLYILHGSVVHVPKVGFVPGSFFQPVFSSQGINATVGLLPPRDMILWVLEFNDEGVIFLQSFSVSVHPDEQRRNSRDGYNSFAEFSMSTY